MSSGQHRGRTDSQLCEPQTKTDSSEYSVKVEENTLSFLSSPHKESCKSAPEGLQLGAPERETPLQGAWATNAPLYGNGFGCWGLDPYSNTLKRLEYVDCAKDI